MSKKGNSAKSETKPAQPAADATIDLDFNVSDEEITRAEKLWKDSLKVDYLKVKSSTYPV